MVKKAIVLAAGFGTRLRPLTCAVPKPLLPVWGETMLARTVALLRGRGVEDIVVNCHYLHGQIEEWCSANSCRAVHEPEILGTGGVLNPLREWIGGDDFYLVNGDIVLCSNVILNAEVKVNVLACLEIAVIDLDIGDCRSNYVGCSCAGILTGNYLDAVNVTVV